MARIVLQPRFYEIGLFPEQYEGLIRDLEAVGHEVTVEEEIEERSAGAVLETAWDVAVRLADTAEDGVVDAIVVMLLVWLKGKAKIGARRGRRAFIYGPDGQVLREVELPAEED